MSANGYGGDGQSNQLGNGGRGQGGSVRVRANHGNISFGTLENSGTGPAPSSILSASGFGGSGSDAANSPAGNGGFGGNGYSGNVTIRALGSEGPDSDTGTVTAIGPTELHADGTGGNGADGGRGGDGRPNESSGA
jgi:hypothetical protein